MKLVLKKNYEYKNGEMFTADFPPFYSEGHIFKATIYSDDTGQQLVTWIGTETVTLNCEPTCSFGTSNGSCVGYKAVIESNIGNNNSNITGKIEHTFEFVSDDYGENSLLPITIDNSKNRGFETKTIFKNDVNEAVSKTESDFKIPIYDATGYVRGVKVKRNHPTYTKPNNIYNAQQEFQTNKYLISSEWSVRPIHVKSITYSPSGDSLVQSKDYFYKSETNTFDNIPYQILLLDNQIKTNSKDISGVGATVNTIYTYSDQNLKRNFILSPVRQDNYSGLNTNGIQLSGVYKNYFLDPVNNYYVPQKISVYNSKLNNYEERSEALSFDKYGNLTSFKGIDSPIITTIVWGVNYTLPIAKIESQLTYNEIIALLGITYESIQNLSNTSLKNAFLSLQARLYNTTATSGFVTVYLYNKYCSIEEIIDPKGINITYEYDDLGRLITVKDQLGNVIEHTEYHYKTEY